MPKPSKKIAEIISTEKKLTDDFNAYTDQAFYAERDRRMEAGKKLDASAEDRAALAEFYSGDFARGWEGGREVAYELLKSYRVANWQTFRDEFLNDALLSAEENLREVDKEVAALSAKYPGLRIQRDPDFRKADIMRIEELLDHRQITGHESLTEMFNSYSK